MLSRSAALVTAAGLLLACVAPACLASETLERDGAAPADDSRVAHIPFEVERDRTIVLVRVADSRPQRLILDTGMPMDGVYLFHKEFESEVPLQGAIEVMIPGAGGGEPSTGIMVESVPLSAGEVVFGRQRVIVSRSDQTQDLPTDGVIGWSLFGHNAVEIDYDEMVITLHPPGTFEPDASWEALPVVLKGNIPWITASVDVLGEGPVDVDCYIDFASGDAVELLVREDAKFPIPEDLGQSYLGTGLSGDIFGGVGRVTSLSIGSHTFSDVPAAFPPAQVRSKQEGADAIIGNQSLRRFNLVFDYAASTLWIKPNGAFGNPF